MGEVKWIKLASDLFNNRKIKQIRKMPDGDAIIAIWLQILCLAGQINDNGLVYFAKDVPYTDEMLSTEFDRPLNTTRLALQTFCQFHMIEIVDSILLVSNWEKYQSIDRLEQIRLQNRARQRIFKEKQKELCESNVTVTLPVTQSNATDKDIDIDKDTLLSESKAHPEKHKHGTYGWVLLTDEEYSRLITDFGEKTAEWAISKIDEMAQSNGNKNKWKDWNLVCRRCIKEKWGGGPPESGSEIPAYLRRKG